MDIKPSGSVPTRRQPKESFTGAVWQDPIIEAPAGVTFLGHENPPGVSTEDVVQRFLDNPREKYAWLREHAPVYFDANSGMWGIATYDAVLAAEKDAHTFSNAEGVSLERSSMGNASALASTSSFGLMPRASAARCTFNPC
jgi:cytochrome P450